MLGALREFIIGLAVELSSCYLFSHTAPLFEKEGDAFTFAFIPHRGDPFLLHRPCSMAALSTNDHPIDSLEIKLAQIFQQRLNGEKFDSGMCVLQILNSWKAVFHVLDAHSPPD